MKTKGCGYASVAAIAFERTKEYLDRSRPRATNKCARSRERMCVGFVELAESFY